MVCAAARRAAFPSAVPVSRFQFGGGFLQDRPEWALAVVRSNLDQFIEGKSPQRRPQDSEKGHVSQRVVDQFEEAEQIENLRALKESAPGGVQRDAELVEFLGEGLCARRR